MRRDVKCSPLFGRKATILLMRRARVPAGARAILYGETPFGWRLSKDRSKLVMDKDEQRLLAVVRHMYFVERINMRQIVQRLAELGAVNRRARPFTLSGVWTMVHERRRRPREATSNR
jgi:hypothetical protein